MLVSAQEPSYRLGYLALMDGAGAQSQTVEQNPVDVVGDHTSGALGCGHTGRRDDGHHDFAKSVVVRAEVHAGVRGQGKSCSLRIRVCKLSHDERIGELRNSIARPNGGQVEIIGHPNVAAFQLIGHGRGQSRSGAEVIGARPRWDASGLVHRAVRECT